MYRLTCRKRANGRGLVPVTAAKGYENPAKAGLDRWTIFIHGFNNSEKSAAATWRRTEKELLRLQVDLRAVVLFYWPGDYSRWEVLSAMNYSRTVPTAEETAKLLADYLQRAAQDRSTPLQLSFVAHSLGSLVVLETLRLLREDSAKIIIHSILLMAAAVPEGFCMPDELYAKRFSSETNEVVLFSPKDKILKWFFKAGQKLAHRLPKERLIAVGQIGGPGAGPDERWTANAHMNGFGHGDYWEKTASIEKIACIVEPKGKNSIQPSGGERHAWRHAMHEDALPTDELDEDDYLLDF